MPKILRARPARDEQEARSVRKVAASRHGPADWIQHAKMVVSSWESWRVEAIATELHCSALTVRRRLHRFDTEGFEGLGDRPRLGRPRRLTHADDSALMALVHTPPPGRLERHRDGSLVADDEKQEATWSLSALAQAEKRGGDPGQTQPDPHDPPEGGGALARHAQLGGAAGQRLRPTRTRVVTHERFASGGLDDHLYRRTRSGRAAHLSPRAGLVGGWAPHQSAVGLPAGAGEDVDLWGEAECAMGRS
jgi:transposase